MIAHKYRVTLPLGTFTFASKGIELDRLIANCIAKGVEPCQLTVNIVWQGEQTLPAAGKE